MNKKNLIIIVVLVLAIVGGLGYWFLNKGNTTNNGSTGTNSSMVNQGGKWNPYSTEDNYNVTLSDQLLSAGGGDNVVKMSITLGFEDQDSYYKYKGYKDANEAKKGEASKASGTPVATPMELKINDTIGELMMKANHEQLTNRDVLKNYLKDGINHKLNFDKPIIKDIYIENFVIQ